MDQVHILAALDGSPASRNAAKVARRLAVAMGGQSSRIAVRPPEGDLPSLGSSEVIMAEGVPSVEICHHAEQVHATLLVLGRTNTTNHPSRVIGQRTGEAVVRRASIPTLHVPGLSGQFTRAVVALDGSERGLTVLEEGTRVAAALKLPIHLVTVEPAQTVPVGVLSVPSSGVADRLSARLADLGVTSPLAVLQGDPVQEILASVTESDLLIVGYRRGVAFLAPEGVGRRLIWQAPCAVLAVPF